MKIAINNYCNSRCPYCFAGNMGIDKNSNISIEDFKKMLDMMVIDRDSFVTLLGGEPTLHPQFREILSIVNEYCRMFGWKFLLLTNGVKVGDYLDLLNKNTFFLINVNCPNVLGKKQYDIMIDSLEKMRFNGFMGTSKDPTNLITLGCNIHAENDDYDYFWSVVDRFDIKNIRVSVVSPTNNQKYLNNRDEYFQLMKPKFMDFILQAYSRNAVVNLDCNQIPPCYFTATEMYMIAKVTRGEISTLGKCDPMFQVMPDLTVSCCFGDGGFKEGKRSVSDFKSIYDIEKYYVKNRKEQLNKCFPFDRCEKCFLRETRMCNAGCFGFKDGKCMSGGCGGNICVQ